MRKQTKSLTPTVIEHLRTTGTASSKLDTIHAAQLAVKDARIKALEGENAELLRQIEILTATPEAPVSAPPPETPIPPLVTAPVRRARAESPASQAPGVEEEVGGPPGKPARRPWMRRTEHHE